MKAKIKFNHRTFYLPEVEPGMLIIHPELRDVYIVMNYNRPVCRLFNLETFIDFEIDENELIKYDLFRGKIEFEQ
jgi:hypothetical protein